MALAEQWNLHAVTYLEDLYDTGSCHMAVFLHLATHLLWVGEGKVSESTQSEDICINQKYVT